MLSRVFRVCPVFSPDDGKGNVSAVGATNNECMSLMEL
jgi:hypothetical protein